MKRVARSVAALVAFVLVLGLGLTSCEMEGARSKGVEKPNADRLTKFPTGRPPLTLERMELTEEVDDRVSYLDLSSQGITFIKAPLAEWEQTAGSDWRYVGDLVCKGFCMMAFSDAVLVIKSPIYEGAEIRRVTELYLTGLRGERPRNQLVGHRAAQCRQPETDR